MSSTGPFWAMDMVYNRIWWEWPLCARERGHVKWNYMQRKVFWGSCLTNYIDWTVKSCCCWLVYTVHGHSTSVTTIINRQQGDKNTNRLHISVRNSLFLLSIALFSGFDFLKKNVGVYRTVGLTRYYCSVVWRTSACNPSTFTVCTLYSSVVLSL